MHKTTCIFCNQRKKRAVEHIWPQWLQIFIGGSTDGHHTGTHISSQEVISQRKQSGQSLVYGKVCRECNNGWMNELEGKAMPIIKQLSTGSLDGEWDEINSHIMAKWAIKTAFMINAGSNYKRLVPKEHYHELFEDRIPTMISVQVGISESTEKSLDWVQDRFYSILRPIDSQNYRTEHLKNAYKISMRIKELLLKVNYWPYEQCEILPTKKNECHRIWPFQNKVSFNFTSTRCELLSFSVNHVIYDE